MRKTGMAAKVRSHLVEMGRRTFSAAKISARIGEPSDRVQTVLRDMLARGEVHKLGPGDYQYLGGSRKERSTTQVRPAVLKAMHVRGSFTAREIGMLADADLNYVRKMIRRLVLAEAIETVARQKTARGDLERIYRVRHRDDFYLKYVRVAMVEGAGRPVGDGDAGSSNLQMN